MLRDSGISRGLTFSLGHFYVLLFTRSVEGLPEFQWRKIGFALEQFTERLGMFKPQFPGNFANRQTGG